jgi:hypothetical protein
MMCPSLWCWQCWALQLRLRLRLVPSSTRALNQWWHGASSAVSGWMIDERQNGPTWNGRGPSFDVALCQVLAKGPVAGESTAGGVTSRLVP